MKQNRLSIPFVQSALTVALAMIAFLWTPAFGQDSGLAIVRSRAEHIAEQRKLEQAFPDLVRTLRTLRLPPDKIAEATSKLRKSEAATRATRQELQSLDEENDRHGFNGRARNSGRAEELRASLQQSTEQLQVEIKTLLTPQQIERFEQHLQKQNRHSSIKQMSSR